MEQLTDAKPVAAGARVEEQGVQYRVWAPAADAPAVVVEGPGPGRRVTLLREEPEGYWSAFDSEGKAGDLYRFELAPGRLFPDLLSRFQPQGVHGPSECVDPEAFIWKNVAWRRPGWRGQTIYELHIGTFTPAGTFRAAMERLAHIRNLGVEVIELMPLAEFGGDRNWGYDGVSFYAPTHNYGRPDDLRALVDAAHGYGLAVILDVVYNHVGPDGNHLAAFAESYFHGERNTPWGRTYNLDGPHSQPVRDFLINNAAYWLDEFRFDGLRLDATHVIHDQSPRHLLSEIATVVHRRGGFVVAEDERNEPKLVEDAACGGTGLDALWSDDFHHQVRVALTGERPAYFSAYGGTLGDLADTVHFGWTYRGQPFGPWAGRPRGGPSEHLPPKAFIVCIENHDQIGNRAKGERLEQLVSPAQFRAASMLLCLGPYAPMLFMGQEWSANSPFQFFTNFGGELGRQVSEGRRREFGALGGPGAHEEAPDPEAAATFARSKLNWAEGDEPAHAGVLELYRTCLRERRQVLTESALRREAWSVEPWGTYLALRYHGPAADHLLLTTFGREALPTGPVPPSLQPPEESTWEPVIHSEALQFGGLVSELDPWRPPGPRSLWLRAEHPQSRHASR